MPVFNLKVDSLYQQWWRDYYEVEAETKEEAIQNVKDYIFECNDFEVLYESAITEQTELEDLEGNVIESW